MASVRELATPKFPSWPLHCTAFYGRLAEDYSRYLRALGAAVGPAGAVHAEVDYRVRLVRNLTQAWCDLVLSPCTALAKVMTAEGGVLEAAAAPVPAPAPPEHQALRLDTAAKVVLRRSAPEEIVEDLRDEDLAQRAIRVAPAEALVLRHADQRRAGQAGHGNGAPIRNGV